MKYIQNLLLSSKTSAPEDTTISISAFESLIDEIDEKVSEDTTLEVLEKPEEVPIESNSHARDVWCFLLSLKV